MKTNKGRKSKMPLKKIIISFLSLICIFTLSKNVQAASAETLTVSAAISLKNAFEEMGWIFEGGHKGVKVLFNFGASGDLVRQIEAGAPVDLFASAASGDMDKLQGQGLIITRSRTDFAGNTLVLITPGGPAVRLKSFTGLQEKKIKKIALGNPKTVPAGRYAQEALTRLKLWEGLKEKLILAENVRQVLDYVARGECDAGLVYATDARTRSKEITLALVAPEGSHQPIRYPIAIIRETKKESLVNEFIALILSRDGKDILQRHGFKNVQGKTK